MKSTNGSGISLIEILIVVTIFAVLGVLVSRAIILTLQGSKKSESLVAVRENLDFSMGVIERQIRNANSVDCADPATTTTSLVYHDQNGERSTFSCTGLGTSDSYISSGSARLTSDTVALPVNGCTFTCMVGTSTNQPYVDISLQAKSSTLTGPQNSVVSASTRIYLRNY